MLVLTQEVKDKPYIVQKYEIFKCSCIFNLCEDMHFEERRRNITSPSAKGQLSGWLYNTAVVLLSSSQVCVYVCVCVSNTPSIATTPTGFCCK